MIKRIIGFSMIFFALFALALSLAGVQQIGGDSYITFITKLSNTYNKWDISIPDIPKLSVVDFGGRTNLGVLLKIVLFIANVLVDFFNVLITIINVLVALLNIVISLIQYFLTTLYLFKDFIKGVTLDFLFVSVV